MAKQTDSKKRQTKGRAKHHSIKTSATRIDSPHFEQITQESIKEKPSDGQPSGPLLEPLSLESVPGETPTDPQWMARLRTQADQLSAFLQKRQEDLDHREARLNARTAEFENEMRLGRMLHEEQKAELCERAAATDITSQPVERRLERVISAEKNEPFPRASSDKNRMAGELEQHRASEIVLAERLKRQEKALAEEAQRLQQRRQANDETFNRLLRNIERRQASIEQAEDRLSLHKIDLTKNQRVVATELASMRMDLDQQKKVLDAESKRVQQRKSELEQIRRDAEIDRVTLRQHLMAEMELRQQNLDEAESRLAEDLTQLESDVRQIEFERKALAEKVTSTEQDLQSQRHLIAVDSEKKKCQLDDQREHLAERSAALDQLQAEVSSNQRETLEMRLATEELWTRLSGAMPSAALTQSLAVIREKLSERYRLDQQHLAQEKSGIIALQKNLGQQFSLIKTQRQELRDWARRRSQEIEQQAARLVAREQELDDHETYFRKKNHDWADERRGLKDTIRQLMSEMRHSEPV